MKEACSFGKYTSFALVDRGLAQRLKRKSLVDLIAKRLRMRGYQSIRRGAKLAQHKGRRYATYEVRGLEQVRDCVDAPLVVAGEQYVEHCGRMSCVEDLSKLLFNDDVGRDCQEHEVQPQAREV